MSFPCTQSRHPIYGIPAREEVEWVWVPVPIKLLPVTVNPTSGFPLTAATIQFPALSSAILPLVAVGTGTAPMFPLPFEGNVMPEESSLDFDLPLDFLGQVMASGPLTAPAPIDLPGLGQYGDAPALPADVSFADPSAYPTPTPGNGTGVGHTSPGTATPAVTPAALAYEIPPYPTFPSIPQPLICPELGCFGTISQSADLEYVNPYFPSHIKTKPFSLASRKQTRTHHRKPRPSNFPCPECTEAYVNQRTLDRHLWSNHEEYAERTGVKSVKRKCSRCKYFGRVDNVKRHEKDVHGLGKGRRGRKEREAAGYTRDGYGENIGERG